LYQTVISLKKEGYINYNYIRLYMFIYIYIYSYGKNFLPGIFCRRIDDNVTSIILHLLSIFKFLVYHQKY